MKECVTIFSNSPMTDMFSRIASSKDAKVLQRNLNTMHRWRVKWLILFNAEQCKCVHYGHNNRHYGYFIGEDPIQTIHEEKDLSVIITYKLEVTKQYSKASKKANAMLGMINRAIKYKTKEVTVQLYKSPVRPYLGSAYFYAGRVLSKSHIFNS